MAVDVRPINDRKELKKFFKFKLDLYKNNPYFVPPLYMDEFSTFDRKVNPAFEFCDMQAFLAYRDGKVVGRIAAIINFKANSTWNNRNGRFGFFDFIDDFEVSGALMNAAIQWCKEKGMDRIAGPLGFTDMDREGMLIEGFEELATMVGDYNYPYYQQHMERMDFVKDVDWVERVITIPDQLPEKFVRVSKVVQEKFKVRPLRYTSTAKIIKDGWGYKVFELVNASYAELYGFSALTKRQIDYYVKQYIPLLPAKFICLIVNQDNELVGMGVAMPSLSKALQKAKGSLFPFGFIHVLKALKSKTPLVDLLLIAVRPDYQSKGVNSIAFTEMFQAFGENGTKFAETNPELELNEKVQTQWESYDTRQHKRRRAFSKPI